MAIELLDLGGSGAQPATGTGGDLTDALAVAIADDRLSLHYQPIVDLRDGTVVGAEALARWPQAAGGSIPPDQFIPAAEESGLIVDLGRWVLERAVRAAASWGAVHGARPRVFVNVSPFEIASAGFVGMVEQVLDDSRVSPQILCLELTESAALLHADEACRRVRTLRDLGVRVGLDDFGTGFATHAALRSVEEVDFLKIDREFVAGLPGHLPEAAIVEAVIDLAHAIDAEVIGEGVEEDIQARVLHHLGCDLAQGYHLSKALPLERFEALLETTAARGAGWFTPGALGRSREGKSMTMREGAAHGTVLVADDDQRIRELVALTFKRAGFQVTEAGSAAEVRTALHKRGVDLLVLDLMLGDAHGLDVLADTHETDAVPTIVLSAQAGEADRILGLQCGADDYVVKPFSPRELVARAEALLRRVHPAAPAVIGFGDVTVDVAARQVCRNNEIIDTTAREFDLLVHLTRRPHTAVSRVELLRDVWNSDPSWQTPSTVTEHVRRLRNKVEHDPGNPRHFITVPGVGYRFEP